MFKNVQLQGCLILQALNYNEFWKGIEKKQLMTTLEIACCMTGFYERETLAFNGLTR